MNPPGSVAADPSIGVFSVPLLFFDGVGLCSSSGFACSTADMPAAGGGITAASPHADPVPAAGGGGGATIGPAASGGISAACWKGRLLLLQHVPASLAIGVCAGVATPAARRRVAAARAREAESLFFWGSGGGVKFLSGSGDQTIVMAPSPSPGVGTSASSALASSGAPPPAADVPVAGESRSKRS